jgi:hypothetical protein
MYSFQINCPSDSTIGLCTYAADGTWQKLALCPKGEEAAGFCIADEQGSRNLKGESKKIGEPVFEEGSQMEVEIDGDMMVILDAKEQK